MENLNENKSEYDCVELNITKIVYSEIDLQKLLLKKGFVSSTKYYKSFLFLLFNNIKFILFLIKFLSAD